MEVRVQLMPADGSLSTRTASEFAAGIDRSIEGGKRLRGQLFVGAAKRFVGPAEEILDYGRGAPTSRSARQRRPHSSCR
jgi:hypothetical protein